MIRRALGGLLAAALLVFAPTAAVATTYGDDDFDARISTSNPAPGEAFTVTVEAPSGTDVTSPCPPTRSRMTTSRSPAPRR